jgi:hypothetical protein
MRHEPLAQLLLHAKRSASYRGIEMVCRLSGTLFQAFADATYPTVPSMEQSVVCANPREILLDVASARGLYDRSVATTNI